MGAVSGDVNTLSMRCATAADLASRPIAGLQDGDRAYVVDREGTPEGPIFFLSKSSAVTVDGVGVLATLGGAGRWLSEAMYGGSASNISVEDIAALGALPDAGFVDGTRAFVQSLKSFWILDLSLSGAGDGITVIPADSGNGMWLRTYPPSPYWPAQNLWYIDPEFGNDEDAGTEDFPIASFAELARRLTGATVPIVATVNVYGDVPVTDPPIFDDIPPGSNIVVEGQRINLIPAPPPDPTFSAVQAINRATNDALEVESLSLGALSWTAGNAVGRMIQITSGPRLGAVAWVLVDMGGANKRARLSPMFDPITRLPVTPQVGDNFRVYRTSVFAANPGIGSFDGISSVTFRYCEFNDETFDYALGKTIAGNANFVACRIDGWMQHSAAGRGVYQACGFVSAFNSIEFYDASTGEFTACGLVGEDTVIGLFSAKASAIINGDTIFQSDANVYTPNSAYILAQNVAIFGNTTWSAIDARMGARVHIVDAIYGDGNAAAILSLGSWAEGVYTVLAALTAVSTAPVIKFGAVTKAWADLPFVNTGAGNNQGGLILWT